MRAVVQRVQEAWVRIGAAEVARIGRDSWSWPEWRPTTAPPTWPFWPKNWPTSGSLPVRTAACCTSLSWIRLELLLVSQFTVLGDCRKAAAPPSLAPRPGGGGKALRRPGRRPDRPRPEVATGRFRQMMEVGLINDGPVTLLLDSKKVF